MAHGPDGGALDLFASGSPDEQTGVPKFWIARQIAENDHFVECGHEEGSQIGETGKKGRSSIEMKRRWRMERSIVISAKTTDSPVSTEINHPRG
ncbi:MAG: hypothetical protein HC808_13410 [Candidatus Competibacteraceae bacterium]|nr:hypothetical protein [Candidatus Competibacteraceae bacterium]